MGHRVFINNEDEGGVLNQQLLAGVAHELKAPLTLISGLSSQLQHNAIDLKKQQQYIQRIQFSSDRLLSLVDTILKGYEVQQQELDLRLEPVNPMCILEDVANELLPHAKKQAQLIVVKQTRHRQTVLADKGCLHAVIFNLLDNAIKYSKAESSIELEFRLRRGQSQIAVKDYGSGIKRSELKRLFEQFGRVKRPVPQWATTTGLGLYVAKQLTEAMNGTLELTRRNNGSSFLVNLQLSQQLNLFDL